MAHTGCELGFKIFNDPIHGHIKVNSFCVSIIDTPEFQRLRYIKQLGTAYFVYPGAPHNRFEHSIGVYHLAGQFVRILKDNQPELDISDDDIRCVEVAGLCHDLGHGPFSHFFDGNFLPSFNSTEKHEDLSIAMLDHLIKNNPKVESLFEEWDPQDEQHTFINELIKGKGTQSKSRPKKKQFLLEIVSNKRNGIDVDKWDYFARDCHMLGIKNNFNHQRYMMFARVIDVKREGPQICARDKEAMNLYDMFHTRATLHKTAYQHKVVKGVDLMILDALKLANDHIEIPGSNRTYKMSESIKDMEAYCKLNDGILQVISLSSKPEMKEAQIVLQNLHSRKLYTCIGESIQRMEKGGEDLTQKHMPEIKEQLKRFMREDETAEEEDDIEVVLRTFNYGMENMDPISCLKFYSKQKPNEASEMPKNEVSTMLPEKFEERVVTVYSKNHDNEDKHRRIQKAFERWCKESRPRMENPKIFLRPESSGSQGGTAQGPEQKAETQETKS